MESHKDELIQMISDQYKSLHGIRPRWEYAEMRGETIEQLQQRLDKLDAEVAGELRQERADAESRDAIRSGAWIGNAEPVHPFMELYDKVKAGEARFITEDERYAILKKIRDAAPLRNLECGSFYDGEFHAS